MIFSISFNWLFGWLIQRTGNSVKRRILFVSDLSLNLLILGFYKYSSFLAYNINQALGETFILELELELPIGISFFTLQAITYVVDVYRRQVQAQRNPLYLGMYIAMFPDVYKRQPLSLVSPHRVPPRASRLRPRSGGAPLFLPR